MPSTFDLSDASKGGPNLPPPKPVNTSRGTGFPVDDYARNVLYLSLAVTAVCLIYVLWGIFGGAWAYPAWGTLDHASRMRHLGNIGTMGTVLTIASVVDVICLAICCLRDESVGYVLLAIAAVLYLGIPILTKFGLDARGMQIADGHGRPSGTQAADMMLGGLTWIYLVPGIIFVIVDFVRRLISLSERAAIQRANMRYGGDAQRSSSKQQNTFLGRCWQLPYCREQVRVKCPVYIRRQGPCWWYKEGCMCEERIVLQAMIDTDWQAKRDSATQKLGSPQSNAQKQTPQANATPAMKAAPSLSGVGPMEPRLNLTAAAAPPEKRGLGLQAGPKQYLSAAQKRERCRNCIIYNDHQRQKYKMLTWVAIGIVPLLMIVNFAWMADLTKGLIETVAKVTSQFSLGGTSAAANALTEASTISGIEYVVMGCVGLVLLSQVLKIIEFCVFKLKI